MSYGRYTKKSVFAFFFPSEIVNCWNLITATEYRLPNANVNDPTCHSVYFLSLSFSLSFFLYLCLYLSPSHSHVYSLTVLYCLGMLNSRMQMQRQITSARFHKLRKNPSISRFSYFGHDSDFSYTN
jgi:hypothetical protein